MPPTPMPPNKSVPSELRAGDAVALAVQTQAPTVSAFLILSSVIANQPTRIRIGDTGVAVDLSGVATFTVPGSTSAAWQPGRYDWLLFGLDANGNRTQLGAGVVNILPDPAGTNPVDPRSYDEKLLDQIKAMLAGKALDDAQMYKIGTRELTKMTLAELNKWQADVEARVRRARRRRRGDKNFTRIASLTFGGGGGGC